MIRYRSFLNTDTPLIVEIWRQQQPFRSQLSVITQAIIDQHVLSKPFFDRHGLIMAVEEVNGVEEPLGFVHAAFAPESNLNDLDTAAGIISLIKVVPGDRAEEVGQKLLQRALEYLKKRGASLVHAGGKFPRSPFYLGIYGGSRIPGVLEKDVFSRKALADFGFDVEGKVVVMERALSGFRTLMDREQMTLRRQYQIKAVADPLESSWWESCTLGLAERDKFSVSHKLHRNLCGTVSYWDIQPLASEWGLICRGMYDLNVTPELRRCGMATFLVGESLRHLTQQGVGRVEAQARESDEAAIGVFKKLGFEPVTHGYLMTKPI